MRQADGKWNDDNNPMAVFSMSVTTTDLYLLRNEQNLSGANGSGRGHDSPSFVDLLSRPLRQKLIDHS